MRPVLFQIGGISIPAYGVMLVISFIVALLFVKRTAKRFNISPVIIENLAFWIMLGVIIGGRIFYVLFHWEDYARDFLGIFKIWTGGMMFFGGFVGAFIAGALYLRKERLNLLLLADIVSPTLGLGEFFTRIGCFLNGCCFGLPSRLPWAVKFPKDSFAGLSPVGNYLLHPTQLYASLFGLLVFFFLRKKLLQKHRRGEIFSLYLVFSGIFRFGIDFIRYYENTANLLINQFVSILIVASGIILLLKLWKTKFEDSPW